MKKLWINALLLTSVAAFGLTACDNKGPAEKAGKNIDESVETIKQKSQEAADDTKKALGLKEKGTLEKAGEKLDDAADDIKRSTN